MANRRCLQVLTRHALAIFSTKPYIHSLKIVPSFLSQNFRTHASVPNCLFAKIDPSLCTNWSHSRYLSSDSQNGNEDDDTEEDDDEDDEDYDSGEDDDISVPSRGMQKEYTKEEKEAEAASIGYKVVGPIDRSSEVFKPYEPVFAVVQIGSHQFKVSNGDSIFTERLKFCDVNDKLILNRVLLLGSSRQTIVGRPTVPSAVVQAVVEEHALDAKVIIFKKKRRKNYRRTKGHRQELTKLRIIDIEGIDKPEIIEKSSKVAGKNPKQVSVAA
ncbi:50S ribosomal protein L21, mitochondrial-like [Cucurbita moschata]|uniref:Large ribosomal subunit protein bL21m n=1 Tax=Cucurbita moschata TaxID=3662 RepID=A0A6J1G4S2_CUCMO|nr:50S ribosomal protein L21, mitochondrial-like [Cucurbita moschata]XP_022946852.1 50S ribosomal protein L21, mitochondrial-like [Cucurbita moschata]XP_022946853.1 50S ribosomal protein L21, mitochondrial-like [Cucurbita moschata]XP_022946854.1 50S ribosomal protein L21, mitochondrial-like [Cucurbita moschata]